MQPNSINLLNILLIAGVIQGFLFNIVTFFKNKLSNKAILFLNLTVFFLSANNLQAWLINRSFISSNFYVKYMQISWYFFLVPMFYLFLINYLKFNKRYKSFLIFSIVLFAVAVITRLVLLIYLRTHNYSPNYIGDFMGQYNLIEETIIFIYSISIFLYAVFIVFTYKKELFYILDFDNLNWIKIFLFFSMGLVLLWVIALYKSYELAIFNPAKYYDPIRISISILIYWLGYHGTQQHRFINNRISIRNQIKSRIALNQFVKIQNEDYVDSKKQHIHFMEIDTYIKNTKKFTNAKLSLETLAEELDISASFLSSIINKSNKTNFTDYINNYRVNQAKELLADKDYANYKILSIGLESGFNSKSTFYAVFKKFTGKTPAEYKKIMLNSDVQ
ncbi:helix-turn-helix transcriptional regulator [Aureibaculum sp. 2210JD6-5]|uniref:helix-turn-helix domain-containing protein n=1 Tax=Aureibaculum sp. 2210JD6-5 TaxID=3103957 RepID=UPI002AAD8526|nr:helix-turn-helix transcriptional regulator [Aureibaculum sp. 2210JD6-5]MDY7393679.1 helix-turn-helix transcriptional regulator [Aureibaculum sp. 2210JD6-5]